MKKLLLTSTLLASLGGAATAQALDYGYAYTGWSRSTFEVDGVSVDLTTLNVATAFEKSFGAIRVDGALSGATVEGRVSGVGVVSDARLLYGKVGVSYALTPSVELGVAVERFADEDSGTTTGWLRGQYRHASGSGVELQYGVTDSNRRHLVLDAIAKPMGQVAIGGRYSVDWSNGAWDNKDTGSMLVAGYDGPQFSVAAMVRDEGDIAGVVGSYRFNSEFSFVAGVGRFGDSDSKRAVVGARYHVNDELSFQATLARGERDFDNIGVVDETIVGLAMRWDLGENSSVAREVQYYTNEVSGTLFNMAY